MPEPNNTFQTAYTPPDNIYLEQNYAPTDSVSETTDRNDYFKFYTLYGGSHLYAALGSLTADADLFVYDQNLNLLASSERTGSNGELINVDLAGNQYFYVRVYAYSGATNYSLYLYNDYAGSTLDTARDIGVSWGQGSSTFPDAITTIDYMDFRDNVDIVKFRMEAPGTISVRRQPTQDEGGGRLGTDLQLLDSGGSVLEHGVSAYGGLDIDRFTLNTGTYYVKLAQFEGSGEYRLRITSDYAGDRTGVARNLGDVTNSTRRDFDMVGGSLGLTTYEDALDLYKFNLTRATPLDLKLTIPSIFAPPTFDADLYLAQDVNLNSFIDAAEIINQSANSGNDSLHYDSLAAGTYYVGVRQNGVYTSYQLDLDSDIDNPIGSASPYNDMSDAQNFGTLVGNHSFDGGFGISLGDFTDFYKFTLAAPGKVSAGAFNNNFYSRDLSTPHVTIIQDVNGNFLADDGEVIAFGSGSAGTSLAAGTYYLGLAGIGQQSVYYGGIIVDYAGDSLGQARAMTSISGATPPTQTFYDSITQESDGVDFDDFYTFTLPGAYDVTLSTTGVEGEDLSLALIRDANNNGVIDPGDILASSDALDSPIETISRTLAGGTYFVRVHGVNGGTNYTLTAGFVRSEIPAAVQVLANGTAWTPAFRQYLEDTGLGDSDLGFAIADGAAQLVALPWTNVNQISLRFNGNVSVQSDDLSIRGVTVANYAFTPGGFSYDPATFTATWTLAANVGRDKLLLDLNGDGALGGDFHFRLNVLPGDADGNGSVTVGDVGILSTNFGLSPRGPRQGDFNGDGIITVGDVGILSTSFGQSLPGGDPLLVAGQNAGAPSATALPLSSSSHSVTGAPASSLFSATPVRDVKSSTSLLRPTGLRRGVVGMRNGFITD